MDRQATEYADQAAKLQPALRGDIDVVLGKTPDTGPHSLNVVTVREE